MAAVFTAFLEAQLSVEVELGKPSVTDVLSIALEVIGATQMEHFEEHFFHQTQQRAGENIFDYVRRVGAIKTLAMIGRCNDYWVAICVSGLTEKCLRDVAEQAGIAASIGCEFVHQDKLVSQLDVSWAKIHRVRRRHAEPQAQEEKLPTDKRHFGVSQSSGSFHKLRILSKGKQTDVADVNSSNAAQCRNEETQSESIAHTKAGRAAPSTVPWKASCTDVKTVKMNTVILLGNKKELSANSLDGANCGAIPVSKSGQMKRTMSSQASYKVTMTMIVRTSC